MHPLLKIYIKLIDCANKHDIDNGTKTLILSSFKNIIDKKVFYFLIKHLSHKDISRVFTGGLINPLKSNIIAYLRLFECFDNNPDVKYDNALICAFNKIKSKKIKALVISMYMKTFRMKFKMWFVKESLRTHNHLGDVLNKTYWKSMNNVLGNLFWKNCLINGDMRNSEFIQIFKQSYTADLSVEFFDYLKQNLNLYASGKNQNESKIEREQSLSKMIRERDYVYSFPNDFAIVVNYKYLNKFGIAEHMFISDNTLYINIEHHNFPQK